MSNQNRLQELSADNAQSLKTLQRAIANSKGQFSLILVRCNYACLRLQILQLLQEQYNLVIQEFPLEPSAKTLYTNILERFDRQQLDALIIWGFEVVEDIDSLLYATNNVRDSFQRFAFPVVLWVRDTMWSQLRRKAPDFINWARPIVEFKITERELIRLLHENAQQAFAEQPEFSLDNAELKAAQQDLLESGQELKPEIQAKLAFLHGLACYKNFHLDDAIKQYEQSLYFWQNNQQYEQSGIVLFHLVLVCYLKGKDYQEKTKTYSQQYLKIFEQIKSSNWSMKYINKLGDVLRQLEEWEQLQLLAQKALVIHQQKVELKLVAQDYTFLAAVALKKNSDWEEAKQLALESLKIFEYPAIFPNISDDESQVLGLNYFILAQAQQQLREIEDAIENLEKARKRSQPQYDPILYVEILGELRNIQFKRGKYLEAFHLKQEQREIANQYGLRAFIGAGCLQPPQRVINPIATYAGESPDMPVEDIVVASGRQKDVEALIERMKRRDCKLTVIYGPSGVGKSSIVQAALVPALERTYFEGRIVLPILLQDYKNWLNRLGECLAKPLDNNFLSAYLSIIIEQLRENEQKKLFTILIFDQFEEFFFDNNNPVNKQWFSDFLRQCLEIPYLKVILSLREDYIHFLLKISRLTSLRIDKNYENILYYLGHFSREDAKTVVQSLTRRSAFPLELSLIEQLVKDLAVKEEIVLPIELQVVGMQLENEKITQLEDYQKLGDMPQEKLVEKFLEDVVQDCGRENENVAWRILYALTDERGIRPLRSRNDLISISDEPEEKIDFILEILSGSGLLIMIREIDSNRYQLIHDYIVKPIRDKTKDNNLFILSLKHNYSTLVEIKSYEMPSNAAITGKAFINNTDNKTLVPIRILREINAKPIGEKQYINGVTTRTVQPYLVSIRLEGLSKFIDLEVFDWEGQILRLGKDFLQKVLIF
ncbi:hypothetical protein WA1_16300 [Scytonema hofmannii PCC 7110]|uniref:Novel STAND NTPase 1 domain-containing protein n=1 Tax=Scytonema hofmannii PCC 7110 TaxID=128403 RepID=A0A139XA95_9CYAN|nr:ATP-binding protein [Scytonema hofmannii]KYC41609.1 hypothetical protein WA1_16300 [Scytonema hofmannii PCC 7110]